MTVDRTRRAVVGSVLGLVIAALSLGVAWRVNASYGCERPAAGLSECGQPLQALCRTLCGPLSVTYRSAVNLSLYDNWWRCCRSVSGVVIALCGYGAPLWGGVAFAAVFFRRPRPRRTRLV